MQSRQSVQQEEELMKSALARAALAAMLCVPSLPLLAAVDPALLAARQKFFGAENVDATRRRPQGQGDVLVGDERDPRGVAQGRIVLLDTYIQRPELRRRPAHRPAAHARSTSQDLVDLHPEAIFLGHGHGDHADNAAYIAKGSNIPIYASPETCDVDAGRHHADVQRSEHRSTAG